jgi:hypothetical protein
VASPACCIDQRDGAVVTSQRRRIVGGRACQGSPVGTTDRDRFEHKPCGTDDRTHPFIRGGFAAGTEHYPHE